MTAVNPGQGVRRNDPCPCGSGKKYKKCCMGKSGAPPSAPAPDGHRRADHRAVLARAIAAQQAGQIRTAETLYRQVVELRPKEHFALASLGRIVGRLGRPAEGVELVRRAIVIHGRDAKYHVLLSELLQQTFEPAEALECAERAIALDPREPMGHCMAASAQLRLNRFDEAIAAANAALAIDRHQGSAGLVLARALARQGSLTDAEDRFRAMATDPAFDAETRQTAWHELGALLDRSARYDEAFEAFETSGRAKAESPSAKLIDRDLSRKRIDGYRRGLTPDLLARWNAQSFGGGGPAPAFLVGFPRSGTTMTEQVLAAHSRVVTSDEEPLLETLRNRMSEIFGGSDEDVPAMLRQLDRTRIEELRDHYWRDVEARFGPMTAHHVFIDKLPLNIVHVGLINVLFPEARLLVALRDPRDVCLSCFTQNFRLNAAMIHYTSLRGAAEFYDLVMGFWLDVREMLTIPHLQVRYEDTVTDLESQARAIFRSLELEWEDDVLAFHEKARARTISTPSFIAVTEPVHTRAIGRWRHYARQFDAVAETLEPYVRAFGYE